MKTWEFTSPEGRTFKVDGPDESTREQAWTVLQERMRQESLMHTPAPPIQAAPPGLEALMHTPATGPLPGPPRLTLPSRNPLEAAASSVLGELQTLGAGARQIGGIVTGERGTQMAARRRRAQLEAEQAERAEQFPVSTFGGQMLPYMLTPQSMVSNIPRAAATGGAIGAVREGGSPAAAGVGAAGGAAGTAVGQTLGTVLSRTPSRLNPFQQRALEQGQAMGLKGTPATETGSRALQILEASLESNPLTSGAGQRMSEANQRVLNRAAVEAVGGTGEVIDDVTLGNAARRIGQTIQSVSKDVKARVDDPFLDALGEVEASVTGALVRTDATQRVRDIVTDLLEKRAVDDVLTGKQLSGYSSELKKAGRQLLRGEKMNPDLAFAYFGLAGALDDLLIRNVANADDAARLALAREQWRNLTFLERPGAVRGGDVSPRVLSNVLRRQAKGEYQRGGRQGVATPTDRLFAAARFGEAFPPMPSSGTAQRLAIPATMGGLGAGSLATGDLFSGAVVGVAAPAMLSRMYGRYPFTTGLLGLPVGTPGVMGGVGGRLGAPLAIEHFNVRRGQ